MNYLITGGTGFIGSYIAKRLLDEKHTVVAFDFQPSETSAQEVLTPDELSRVKIVQGDVSDLDQLLRVCEEYKVERLIHMAAILAAETTGMVPNATKINCVGTTNVFEVARRLNIPRVVWASSTAVFGTAKDYSYEFLPNDAPHHPLSVYGACKQFCEFIANFYFRAYGLDSIGIRFPVVYGQGRLRGGGLFANEVINKPALGQKGEVTFSPNPLNWLYPDDAARCVVMASQAPHTETRVFTLSGELRTLNQIADIVRSLIPGADITVHTEFSKLEGSDMTHKFDASQVEKELGFRPEWSIEAGVKATINKLRSKAGLSPVG
ncbi:MAG: NAD(P)-dependent oxidoreductase [Treponema sp.]|jgi:nucleoside-diphosphate-sugar epimerase|nr:NAD(P)-dependent oxidoreductase [Treponema sp.]